MSDYNAWQTELRATNLWNQLSLNTNFTWSKTTDNVSEIFSSNAGGNTTAISQDPFNYISAEHGLSGQDIPKSWTLSFVEEIPLFKSQRGVVGHILGGWGFSGSYLIASGQTYTPAQAFLTYSTGGGGTIDTTFNSGFFGYPDGGMRPFIGNTNAPISQVGIYAGDLCSYDGAVGCNFPPNTVLSFNAYNAGEGAYVMGPGGAHFIVNGATAQSIYGTPWGNAGRNTLRDYQTNSANFAVYKRIKVTERIRVRFDTVFENVFNHPNFGSIDAYLDDAGYLQEYTGFAIPTLQDGGNGNGYTRRIIFGLRVEF